MMHRSRIFIVFIQLLTIATCSYAFNLRQEDDRERWRSTRPAPQVEKPQAAPLPVYGRERQDRRHESYNTGPDAAGFRAPQTVNMDRLKLQSDTPAEYQFEQVPTQTFQQGEPASAQEMKIEELPESAAEEQPREQAAEEIATTEPAPEEMAEVAAQSPDNLVTAGGGVSYRIIEESNRIIVQQIEAAPAADSTTHQ